MPPTPAQRAAAQVIQHAAAHDGSTAVRLVAGPGTGKSYSIGERVAWLLAAGVPPGAIQAVSFTRAAAKDLRLGIVGYCAAHGQPAADQIPVSTLHGLALRILALGNQLAQYPARPRILDDWEQRYVFDQELQATHGYTLRRCGEIRQHFEARWSTGAPPLPFVSFPQPPISVAEEAAFQAFYNARTQLYSCLLPGEAVRKCLVGIIAGVLNPQALLGAQHLIVDEYQDLNLADVELVDRLAQSGMTLFVCGDDDQSIYSFRYAYPTGIQQFSVRYPHSGTHALDTCFRCANSVLQAATSLLANAPSQGRIPKVFGSVYAASAPPVAGVVDAWHFTAAADEAAAISTSVQELITVGIPPEEILILLASRHELLGPLERELNGRGIAVDIQQAVGLANAAGPRFVLALLRFTLQAQDYLALRTILGARNRVGIRTCNDIAQKCVAAGANFAHQFAAATRSAQLFVQRETNALSGAESAIGSCAHWVGTDTLAMRAAALAATVGAHLSVADATSWNNLVANLPADITLDELVAVLEARSDGEARERLTQVFARLALPIPPQLSSVGRVRIMTLHSSKGLSARVVFIPGLEEEILPGPKRAAYAGQIEEAARLLYVGITRARAACFLSYADRRLVNGAMRRHHASRFNVALGAVFASRVGGLTNPEAIAIATHAANL